VRERQREKVTSREKKTNLDPHQATKHDNPNDAALLCLLIHENGKRSPTPLFYLPDRQNRLQFIFSSLPRNAQYNKEETTNAKLAVQAIQILVYISTS